MNHWDTASWALHAAFRDCLLPALAVQLIEDSGDDVGIFDAGDDVHGCTKLFGDLVKNEKWADLTPALMNNANC